LSGDRANQEHLLHFWHLSDTEGVLKNMLNVLAKDVRVDCDGNLNVDTTQVQHKRKKTQEEEDEAKDRKSFRHGLNQSMSTVAITAIRENLAATVSKAAEYEIKALTESDPSIKAVYTRLMNEQKEMAKDIKKELDQEMVITEGLGYKRRTDADTATTDQFSRI